MKSTTYFIIVFFYLLIGPNTINAQGGPPPLPGFTPFITLWETTTDNESITIPTYENETYEYEVDWGDGTVTFHSNADATTNASHIYTTAGTYTVSIIGQFPRIYFNNNSSAQFRHKIKDIIQWGNNRWSSMEKAFYGCYNLDITAPDTPNLDNVDTLYFMLAYCQNLIGTAAFNSWDVSNVKTFSAMFLSCQVFNQPINDWDMTRATHTIDMFNSASMFNQPLDAWDTSKLSATSQMFRFASNFNQNLGSWNISELRWANTMFGESGMTTENYDATLIGWATDDSGQQDDGIDDIFVHPTNPDFSLNLGASSISYCTSATARQYLIDTYGWTITDDGLNSDCGKIVVSPKISLQGAILNPNVGEENLMRDDLRVANLLPTTSPYEDMITCDPTIFNTTGNDAIVDWVWVELRNENDKTSVLAAQSALLQRDGDIMRNDGSSSSLAFDLPPGNYHVTIKHRTHLGVMSTYPKDLKLTATILDFTDPSTPTYGSNAQTSFGTPSGIMAMWTGNANGDTIVQYSGTNPDTPDILSFILNDPGNFLNFPTYITNGYSNYDLNMDGKTQYSGSEPDSPFILQNVLAHPGNFLNFSTYQITEQLPENE